MSYIEFETQSRTSVPYFRPFTDGKIVHKITRDAFIARAVASGIPMDEVEKRLTSPYTKDTPPFTIVGDTARARYWVTPIGNGISYEDTCDAISGTIIAIKFNDHPEYGQSINLTLRQPSGAEAVFSVNTKGQYGTSLMEKLPNVDFDVPVKLSTYVRESGDRRSYHTVVSQKDTSISSFFKTWNDDKKAFDILNGYPQVDEKEQKKFGEDYFRTRYYPEVKVFLVDYTENNIMPKVNITRVEEVPVVGQGETEVVYDNEPF